MIQYIL